MRGWPEERAIIAEFARRSMSPTQVQLDALTQVLGIPLMALAHDHDGGGFAVGMMRVERSGRTFEFTENPDATPVCGFVAPDRWGEAIDIAAWSPHDNWVGTWLNRAVLLGENVLQHPRIGGPVKVFLTPPPWLRASRDGCVILDRRGAWLALEGVTVEAESIETGLNLRRILWRPAPKILVPGLNIEAVAA